MRPPAGMHNAWRPTAECNVKSATDKQRSFAASAARLLGTDVETELDRLGLRDDIQGYRLLIEWMVWAIKRQAHVNGCKVPRVLGVEQPQPLRG